MTSEASSGGAPMGRRRFIQATAALASGLAISAVGTEANSILGAGSTLIRPQVRVPTSSTDPELAAELRRARALPASDGGDLLVLNYHKVFGDLRAPPPAGNAISVTVSQLMSHLMMLRSAGFKPVRLADVVRARRLGASMPPRSVLITFDDGTAGQWIHGDAVLRRAGFSAVTFLITGYVGAAAAFLNWNEVRSMVASGRWEVGDHTHNDHHGVQTGPSAPMMSALISRAWNPRTRTLETLTAAQTRVRTDFDLSLTTLNRERLARPLAFAYPFSRVEGPTNDRGLTEYVEATSARLFPLRFTNYSPGRLVTPADLAAGLLPRFEVHRQVSAFELYDQIRAANVAAASPNVVQVVSAGIQAHGWDHAHPLP